MASGHWLSLLSLRGRLRRGRFWLHAMGLTAVFILAFVAIEDLFGHPATLALYPPAFWLALRMATQRYHDLGRTAWWLLLLAIPLLGPLCVAFELFGRGGTPGDNRYGPDPLARIHDYHVVP